MISLLKVDVPGAYDNHFMPRLRPFVQVDCVPFNSQNLCYVANEFFVGFAFLRRSCNGDSDVLLVKLNDLAGLAVGFGFEGQSEAFGGGDNAVGSR